MLQTLSKKLLRCLAVLIVITCTSCKTSYAYLKKDYLNELAYRSGINLSRDVNQSFNNLLAWEVVSASDKECLEEELDYDFLSYTISNLMGIENGFEYLKNNKWIGDASLNAKVDKKTALSVIDRAVSYINNPEIEDSYYANDDSEHIKDYKLIENRLEVENELKEGDIVFLEDDGLYKKVVGTLDGYYLLEDEDVFDAISDLEFSGSEYIDFEEAEVIPYEDSTECNDDYVNNNYELLASKRKEFTTKGFRVSYSLSSSGIDARISKSIKDNFTAFFDISLSNVKPSYKWHYQNGDVIESFFKINYKLTNELGVSCGKYSKYYLDFKNLSSSSFLNKLKSSVKKSDDEVEFSIPICTIKTPISGIPSASFNIEVVAKVYVSGKIEIVLYNQGEVGFASRNGNFRVINEVDKDSDFIIGASARAVAGLNFNIETAKKRLMDVEFDAGVRAAVSSTIHLYDENGNEEEVESDIAYAALEEISKENNSVKVCGDVSLNWVFDIQLNTAKSLLHKYGLTYTKEILNTKDQIFGNLTHIENFMFVKKCTRKSRNPSSKTKTTKINSDKLELEKYSAVVIVNSSYQIPIKSIPSSYTIDDLVYSSDDTSIISVDSNGLVKANTIGSTKVTVSTNDNKYKAAINILVSTG